MLWRLGERGNRSWAAERGPLQSRARVASSAEPPHSTRPRGAGRGPLGLRGSGAFHGGVAAPGRLCRAGSEQTRSPVRERAGLRGRRWEEVLSPGEVALVAASIGGKGGARRAGNPIKSSADPFPAAAFTRFSMAVLLKSLQICCVSVPLDLCKCLYVHFPGRFPMIGFLQIPDLERAFHIHV